jgi:hypothetical protein
MMWCTNDFFINFNRPFDSEPIAPIIVGINAGFISMHHKGANSLLNSDTMKIYCQRNNMVFPLDTVNRPLDHNFILYITFMRSYEQILDGENKLELMVKNLGQAVEDYKVGKLMPELDGRPENVILWGPLFTYETGNIVNSKEGFTEKIKLGRKRNTFYGVPRLNFRSCNSMYDPVATVLNMTFMTGTGVMSIQLEEKNGFLPAKITKPSGFKWRIPVRFLDIFTPFIYVDFINGVELKTDKPQSKGNVDS